MGDADAVRGSVHERQEAPRPTQDSAWRDLIGASVLYRLTLGGPPLHEAVVRRVSDAGRVDLGGVWYEPAEPIIVEILAAAPDKSAVRDEMRGMRAGLQS